jgi:hypothetical protein
LTLLQPVASAVIMANHDIFSATERGDVALVRDLLLRDASCVGKRNSTWVALIFIV